MQEASFIGFVKTLLIILLIYFAVKIIFKWFGPQIMRYIFKKVGQRVSRNFQQQQQDFRKQHQQKEEFTIDRDPKKNKKSNKNVGEYIDYEEID